MSQPKLPDDGHSWKSIDIYMFSNGEQHSPPRKYHFRSEELEQWLATLSYIAHSQYGSKSREKRQTMKLNTEVIKLAGEVNPSNNWVKSLSRNKKSSPKEGDPDLKIKTNITDNKNNTTNSQTTLVNIVKRNLNQTNKKLPANNIRHFPILRNPNSPSYNKTFEKRKSAIFKSFPSKNKNDKTPSCLNNLRCKSTPKNTETFRRIKNPASKEIPTRNTIDGKNYTEDTSFNHLDKRTLKNNNLVEIDKKPKIVYPEDANFKKDNMAEDNNIKISIEDHDEIRNNEITKILDKRTLTTFANSEESSSILSATQPSPLQRTSNIFQNEKKISNDEFFTVINKGDVLNLQFRLLIENGEPKINTKISKIVLKNNAPSTVFTKDEGSQINIDIVFSETCFEDSSFTNSLEPVHYNEYIKCVDMDGSSKIVFVKSKNENSVIIPCKENIEYVILLTTRNVENFKGCICENAVSNIPEQVTESTERSSVIHDVTKSRASTSLLKLKQKVPSKDFTNPDEQHEKSDNPKTTDAKNCSRVSVDLQYDPNHSLLGILEPVEPSARKDVKDECTQTGWSNVVLEVKDQKDGGCVFHFPPLQILKQCNLQ